MTIFVPFRESGCRTRHHASRVHLKIARWQASGNSTSPVARARIAIVFGCSTIARLACSGRVDESVSKRANKPSSSRSIPSQKASRGDYVEPAKCQLSATLLTTGSEAGSDRRPSHTFNLRTGLDKQILPVFGKQKLDQITVEAMEKLRRKLWDQKYAHRTINRILWIVGAVFRLAIKRGQWSKNPSTASSARSSRRGNQRRRFTVGTGTDAVDPDSVLSPKEIQACCERPSPVSSEPS